MILNQKTGYEVEEMIDNKGKNKYQEIFKKAHDYVRLKMRVENINSKLMTNLQNPEIKKKILKIEEIIIDFLINLSFDRELISNKKYLRLGTKLEEMIRYITGWLKKYVNSKE